MSKIGVTPSRIFLRGSRSMKENWGPGQDDRSLRPEVEELQQLQAVGDGFMPPKSFKGRKQGRNPGKRFHLQPHVLKQAEYTKSRKWNKPTSTWGVAGHPLKVAD